MSAAAGRQAFGTRWFIKLGLISFAAGGLLEFAMIQSGFYGAVVATSSAPDWQESWQGVGAEVQRQLREKQQRGDSTEAARVERVLKELEARHHLHPRNQAQPGEQAAKKETEDVK